MSTTINHRFELADDALQFLGFPSRFYRGPLVGQDISGFDCSGYLTFLLRRRNFPYPESIRHANEFFDQFGVLIHSDAADRGDLVFFSRKGVAPTHVGIMLSRTEYIHAPGKDHTNVEISRLENEPVVSSAPCKIYYSNPIGFKRLSVRNGRYSKVL